MTFPGMFPGKVAVLIYIWGTWGTWGTFSGVLQYIYTHVRAHVLGWKKAPNVPHVPHLLMETANFRGERHKITFPGLPNVPHFLIGTASFEGNVDHEVPRIA